MREDPVRGKYEKKMRAAYPVVLTAVALVLLFGFSGVIARMGEGWKREYARLPVVHGFLLRVALWIRHRWWLVLGGAVLVCAVTAWVNTTRRRKYGW